MQDSFSGSPRSTIGMELEFQLVDPSSGDLAPGAMRVLSACQTAGLKNVSGEMLLSMIEVKSEVCASVHELRADLLPRIRQLRNIVKSLGFDLAMGGAHPLAKPTMSAVSPDERSQTILKRQGWMAYQEAVFGLHIHIGVPDGDAAIGIMNNSVEYLPHFLALSANSPFWQGVDTDYVSTRARMFRPSANTGIPIHFSKWNEFLEYCAIMREGGLLQSTKDMYWDIRPAPNFGTVEYRVFDMPSTLSEAFGLAALTHSFVVSQLRAIRDEPQKAVGDRCVYWLATENRWLATRFGLQTQCIRRPGSRRQSILQDLLELVHAQSSTAEELHESEFLPALDGIEVGAERQRRIFRQAGNWKSLVDEMIAPWQRELDSKTSG